MLQRYKLRWKNNVKRHRFLRLWAEFKWLIIKPSCWVLSSWSLMFGFHNNGDSFYRLACNYCHAIRIINGIYWLPYGAQLLVPIKGALSLILNLSSALRFRPSSLFQFIINFWEYEAFGRTPWTGDRPVARPPSSQANSNTNNADIHPRPDCDLNPRSLCLSGHRHCAF
jgi:hypothetical protein